jgi:hypothetical protein
MSLVTNFLQLFKHDTTNDTDLNSNFDIDTALNDNWDKIDAGVKKLNDEKVDQVSGKSLSTNDFTNAYKSKLDGVAAGAQVNVVEGLTLGGTALSVSNKKIEIKDSEVTNARKSTIKNKTFSNVAARIEELEEDVDNIEAVRGHIYGVRRKITNNTSTAWERIKDSVGLVANATKNGGTVVNNFDDLAPWSEIKSCNYDIETGKVKAWFGDATFNFDGSNGDVFTYIPDVYLKIYQEDDYDYILLSDIPRSGFTKYDSFFIARYAGSVVDDKLHSYSGLAPTVSKTIAQFRTLARALGDKFSLLDYRYFIIQMLYLVEYANYNSQSMLGNGVMSITWDNKWDGLSAGGCDSLGMKSGCLVNDGKNSVIYRGIENPYGNMWQFVDGITVVDRIAYICKDHSQYADSKTASPYKKLGYVNGDTNGWTKNLGFDPDEPLARFPVEIGGSSSAGTGDYYYQNTGTLLARVGGSFDFGANGGFWCWYLRHAFSLSSVNAGCRLLIDNQ